MKILAVHSALLKDTERQSQVDHWRIYRPMRELAKNTGWQIDHEPAFVPGIDKYKNLKEFTPEEMEKAFEKVSSYDIVFSSYHPDPTAYTMLKVAKDRTGTQFVMDCDDDMFAINPDNPFWMKMDDEKVYWMQCMIRDNAWITTPSEVLATAFRQRRKGHHADTVQVIPNYLPDDYQHPPFDNGDKIVIGYCGGSSHYRDLHESGALDAIAKIMHENKKVHFKSVGMLLEKYTPKARTEFNGGKRGTKFLTDIYPNLNFDIGIGPLLDNIFNRGKSNIKWQEMTRAGAVFIASRVGPYAPLSPRIARTVPNNPDDWYKVLKEFVDDVDKRKTTLANAQEELAKNWRLENNWQKYKEFFEKVRETQSEHSKTSTKPTILQA